MEFIKFVLHNAKRLKYISLATCAFVVFILIANNKNPLVGDQFMQIVNLSAKEKTLPKWSRQCEHNNISVEEFKSIFKSTEKYLIAGGLFGSCGGLGNQMFRFAGLYGIGKPYGRIPIFLKRQNCHRGFEAHESEGADEMDRLFPNYAKYLKFSLNTFVADRPNETRVLNGFASDCCRYDDPKRVSEQNALKLCVHTRIGDFAKTTTHLPSEKNFTEKAIEFTYKYLTQKHQRPVAVVLFGEDKKFFGNLSIDRKLIRSIYTPKSMSRAEDLVFVSTTCDSMLITCPSSTFSWWMAYLMPDGATTLPKWSRQCEHNNISVEEFKRLFQSTEKYLIAGGLFGSCGGLGNQMFRFAGLYGIGKPYGRIPIFLKRQNCHRGFEAHESEGADEMDRLFPNYAKYLKISLNTFVADRPKETRVLNGFASDCCRYDDPKRVSEQNALKLCVHTRIGDFAKTTTHLPSEKNFTEKAIEFTYKYLTQKHQQPVAVVLFGEDKKFFGNLSIDRKLIRSIYTPKSMSRAEDLVFVSTTCDSMLITCPSSTFSWWMAYLMPDGATVFYSAKLEATCCFVALILIANNKNPLVGDQFMQIVNLSAKEKTLPKWSRQCEHNNISVEEFKRLFQSTEKYLIAGGLFGSCGGLGNQMFRFAGLYGIGKPYGRIPIFLKRQNCHRGFEAHESEGADEMDRLFPNYAKYLKFSLNTFVADRPNETRVLNGFASDCCRYDDPKRVSEQNALKLCVHTRIGDFAKTTTHLPSEKNFTEKAIEFTYKYLTQKHQRPVAVVLFGEDKKFFGNLSIDSKLIRSIYTPKSMSRAEDLVFVSTTCDTMLITCPSSTFSWWMAYLMPDGATIFYSAKLEGTVYARENFLPEWIPLRLKENTIVID
ncbi:hypothetical protein GPALN_010182 [Globodera pallida]|nr:hypothetical protein GPALN_010182 [Globodera pallida]